MSQQESPQWLPILIIPGFMSSGLEVRESQIRPSWNGKRIWINLSSLGLSSLYFGSAQRAKSERRLTPDDQAQQQERYKSAWLEHMRLNSRDMTTEPKGVQIRAIPGLEGVDYLSPGTFTNMVSYVFGPVIQACLEAGYQEGVNLQAASYDWRIPPSELEARDSYFTRTIQQVENLYQKQNTPVVILGHSLGTKTAHYFLNFCLQTRGQAWLDQHIHTYMPVGGPHLGAPKALRSVVAGDKMSLDAFLNDEEALVMGRSFGSGPWLFPQHLPAGVPASAYVLPHGVLEISCLGVVDTHPFVANRTTLSKPNRYQLMVACGSAGREVRTPFHSVSSTQPNQVAFSDQISFATDPDPGGTQERMLQFVLLEPGISAAKNEKVEQQTNPILCCLIWLLGCCIFDWIYRFVRWILCGVVQTVVLSADALTSAMDGATPLALSRTIAVPKEAWEGKSVSMTITLLHKDDLVDRYDGWFCFRTKRQPRTTTIQVIMKWTAYNKERSFRPICSPICQTDADCGASLQIAKSGKLYQEFSGYDILEREGLDDTLRMIRKVYDADSDLGPRTISSSIPPPVRRVHAIYGINLPTEVGGVYKRKDTCLSASKLKNLYKLDSRAAVKGKSGYIVKGGLLMETKSTPQTGVGGRKVSGDGTVPYWSLQHCRSWKSADCDVTVVELDKAEHREILADPRFHKELLKYCRLSQESV